MRQRPTEDCLLHNSVDMSRELFATLLCSWGELKHDSSSWHIPSCADIRIWCNQSIDQCRRTVIDVRQDVQHTTKVCVAERASSLTDRTSVSPWNDESILAFESWKTDTTHNLAWRNSRTRAILLVILEKENTAPNVCISTLVKRYALPNESEDVFSTFLLFCLKYSISKTTLPTDG